MSHGLHINLSGPGSIELAKKELSKVREQISSQPWKPEPDEIEATAPYTAIEKGDAVRVIDSTLRGTVL